jgi:hypothetical protein
MPKNCIVAVQYFPQNTQSGQNRPAAGFGGFQELYLYFSADNETFRSAL